MHKSNHTLLREYLLSRPAGATVIVLSDDLSIDHSSITRSLKGMPDAYITRWCRSPSNQRWMAVWDVVRVPPNCERPK